ncbi:MAG: HEAT repeat domain-containing protein, partial [Acidobacteriota bacterium]
AELEDLVAGLGSADPREVRHSLDLLVDHGRGRLVPPVMLAHGDPGVRRRTLDILRRERRVDAAPRVEGLLADPEPEVRTAAVHALVALTTEDPRGLMEARLRDPDPRVRAVAVSYLAARSDPGPGGDLDVSLGGMLADPDPQVRLEATRALAEFDEPHGQAGLVQLLYDADLSVARGALGAVVRRCERGGRNPLYVPILVSHLRQRRLKHEARSALVGYGEEVVPALQHFLVDPQEAIWVRRALPKTIARIGGEAALRALTDSLGAADPFQRRKVIESLTHLRQTSAQRGEELRPEPGAILHQVGAECRAHLRGWLDLEALQRLDPSARDHLLHRLLRERLGDHVDNVFGMLELMFDAKGIRAAHRGLLGDRSVRSHALEFLDNLLEGDLRQWTFAVIDDLPAAERTRLARRLFGLEPEGPHGTLSRLAGRRHPGDADAPWLTASALHFIHDQRLSAFYDLIHRSAEEDSDPLVLETTSLLRARMALGDSAS